MDEFRENYGTPPGAGPVQSGTPSGVPTTFDPALGTSMRGVQLNETCFVATTTFNQLRSLIPDPRSLIEQNVALNPQLANAEYLNREINRPFTSAKLRNVASYAAYIAALMEGRRVGVLPPIVAYHEQLLQTDEGRSNIGIPYDTVLGTLDGQTQLAAHFELWKSPSTAEIRQRHGRWPLLLIIHHGIPVSHARQFFHDLNVLGVSVTTGLALAMDSQDPIMKIVRELENNVPLVRGKIDYQSRQLKKGAETFFTVQTMRQFVVNIAKGLPGMQFGTKAVDLAPDDIPRVSALAVEFLQRYLGEFSQAVFDRDNSLAGAPAVMAALGARLNDVLQGRGNEESASIERILAQLRNVNWSKSVAWSGIAGKVRVINRGPRTGEVSFAVGGPKETAYSIYSALFGTGDGSYHAVREPTAERIVSVDRPEPALLTG